MSGRLLSLILVALALGIMAGLMWQPIHEESATAAKRIHDNLPHVKLVFILREPAERAYSNYLWSRKNGLESEEFEKALQEAEDPKNIGKGF